MKTSKVRSVEVAGSYNGQHGEMWNHNYEMEDGQKIQASHKKQLPINVGEEVEYEVKRTHPTYGDSGSVKKPSNNFGGGRKATLPFNEVQGMVRSNAIHAVVSVNATYGEERLKGESLPIIESFTRGEIKGDIDKWGTEHNLLTGRLAAVNNATIASGYISINNGSDLIKLAEKYFNYTSK